MNAAGEVIGKTPYRHGPKRDVGKLAVMLRLPGYFPETVTLDYEHDSKQLCAATEEASAVKGIPCKRLGCEGWASSLRSPFREFRAHMPRCRCAARRSIRCIRREWALPTARNLGR